MKTVYPLQTKFARGITIQKMGICLDQAQIDTLSKTWLCEHPEKLSAFRDEYRSVFPVHDSSLETLQVPSLDDLLEPMLSKSLRDKVLNR